MSTHIVVLKTWNFNFGISFDYLENEVFSVHPKFDDIDDLEEKYNYNDTQEIYKEASKVAGAIVWINPVFEGQQVNDHKLYYSQEYRLIFDCDEWQVSTTFYMENTTILTQTELWDYAMDMFPESIGDVLREYKFTEKQMIVEVLGIEI